MLMKYGIKELRITLRFVMLKRDLVEIKIRNGMKENGLPLFNPDLLSVVLLMMTPSTPTSLTTPAISSISSLFKSGAIFTTRGSEGNSESLEFLTCFKSFSIGSFLWRDRSPGVFGLLILITI